MADMVEAGKDLTKKLIFVIGQGGGATEKMESLGVQVGQLIAQRNGILICGGGSGVMRAAAKGANLVQGTTIGFHGGVFDPKFKDVNPYLDIDIFTGLGNEFRSILAISASDAIIVIGGGNGTLGEISWAYFKQKPLILLAGSGGWVDRLRPVLIDGKYMDERRNTPLHYVDTPETAVDLACELISSD